MADSSNSFPVKGIIHSMPVRTEKGKKDPTKTYEFRSLVLEVNTGKDLQYEDKKTGETKQSYKRSSELWKFDLERWVNLEDYAISDPVEINYSLRGNEYINKKGEKDHILKAVVTSIKYAPMDNGQPRPSRHKVDPIAPQNSPKDFGEDDQDLPF